MSSFWKATIYIWSLDKFKPLLWDYYLIFEKIRRGASRVGGFTDLSGSVTVATQERHWRCFISESTAPNRYEW
ncbi:hypothetical protein [uncultured Nostoc sp.]|uniref:hypothetical protein n=1 Tax=uncultured Nostoc sp. TaxID=340711 RepID=UPI0035CBE23E